MQTDDIARIAAGLTKAQRGVLLGAISERSYHSYRCIGASLQRMGLFEPVFGGFYQTTPLGLRVRAHLQDQRHD